MTTQKFEARAKVSAAIERSQVAALKLTKAARLGPAKRLAVKAESDAAYKAMMDALAECRATA